MGGTTTISTKAEKIAGFQVQTSAYGLVIPVVYGKNRVPANLLYFNDFIAIPHTETTSGGGKGGGVKQKNTTYTYTGFVMLGLVAGPITAFGRMWADKDLYALAGWSAWTRMTGAYGQAVWASLTSAHPSDADPYSGIAWCGQAAYDMGDTGTLKNHTFEITGFVPVNAGVNDNACPADIIKHMFTDPYEGVGFPLARLGDLSSTSDYWEYCAAQGLLFSPLYAEQRPVREHATALAQASNSEFVWSGGLLKVVPYADSNVSGSSTGSMVNYTANVTPVYDLTDNDFQGKPGEDPVRLIRKRPADAWNQVQIEFNDAALDYNTNIAEAKDQANIELYGLRTEDPLPMNFVTTASTAAIVAQLIMQHKLYVRNTYEFNLSMRYALLEPMDLVTLTDSNLGLVQKTVRIIAIDEDENLTLRVTAIEWPFGVATPALYSTTGGTGYSPDTQAAPGNANTPAVFEPPMALTYGDQQIWLGTMGGDNWGGAEVWVSQDNVTYERVGVTYKGCRHGVLSANYTGTTMAVDLTMSKGSIISASASDYAALLTQYWVDGEIQAYQTATLGAAYNYTLSTITRGLFGTVQANHNINTKWMRLDDAVFKFKTPQNMVGKTLYIKLRSFNLHGNALQDLASVSAHSYVVVGTGSGTGNIAAPTGVTIAATNTRPA